jgi:hypothetical protein
VFRFILEIRFARNISWPSLQVTSEYSLSPSWVTMKRGSMIFFAPPEAVLVGLPALAVRRIGDMKSNSWPAKASFDSVEYSGPPLMLSAAEPSPFRIRSALAIA